MATASVNHLLLNTMARIARFMEAERAAMFLYDQENDELWSIAATGRMDQTIRIPADKGIAGHVMSSGEVLNIADAYKDPRFNQEVDRRTGFRTQNILCVPVHNDAEKRIGVVQLLNKAGGFSKRDAQLLAALTQQSAIAIENAQLSDHLQALRQSEQALQEALTQQHLDLQQAYQRIEQKNLELGKQVRARRIMRNLAILGLVGLVAGFGWFNRHFTSLLQLVPGPSSQAAVQDESSFSVFTVQSRPITDQLRLSGILEPLSLVSVLAPFNGTIIEQHFTYGEDVRKGDLLFVLNTEQLEVEHRQSQTEVITAREKLAELETWEQGLDVTRARREMIRAQQSILRTEHDLRESRALFNEGIIPASELRQIEERLENQQLDIESSQESLETVLSRGSADKVEVARLNLLNAEQRLRETAQRLSQASIASPVDGLILQLEDQGSAEPGRSSVISLGSQVTQYQRLFTIADLRGVSVSSSVDETSILKMLPGQAVSVTGEAFPGLVLEGHIRRIGTQAMESGQADRGPRQFEVEVAVPEVDGETRKRLRLGMSADLTITTYENPQAVVVPFQALQSRFGSYFVEKKTPEGAFQQMPVQTGTLLPDGIEILSGVTVGDDLKLMTVNR